MMSHLEQSYTTNSFPPVNHIFANNYFFTDNPPAPPLTTLPPASRHSRAGTTEYGDLASRLVTLRYRWRAPVSGYGYAVKSIIDPMACLRMHNHYCWEVTAAYKSRGSIEVVPDTVAVNQHYKKCHLNASQCAAARKAATVDSLTMERYAHKLVTNVVSQIRAIFGLSAPEFLRQFT